MLKQILLVMFTVSSINKYSPYNFYLNVHFLLNQRYQILDEAVWVHDAVGKGINPYVLSTDMEKIVGQALLFSLVLATSLGEKNSKFRRVLLCLKIDTCHILPIVERLDKGWFVWFYGISTFVGYLTPNPFLCK